MQDVPASRAGAPALPGARLILASASPRRRSLLEEAGFRFEIQPADLDEEVLASGADPADLPEVLAHAKARAVASRHQGERVVVLAADTVVYSTMQEVLGKPRDRADAGRMLRALSGTIHRVVTGICCQRCDSPARIVQAVRTDVMMRPLADDEIETYLDTGQWEGKAGGYGIQDTPGREIGAGDPFIENIEGELTNVIGLPMPQVIDALRTLGLER